MLDETVPRFENLDLGAQEKFRFPKLNAVLDPPSREIISRAVAMVTMRRRPSSRGGGQGAGAASLRVFRFWRVAWYDPSSYGREAVRKISAGRSSASTESTRPSPSTVTTVS